MSSFGGIPFPSDFPLDGFDRVHRIVCDSDPERREKPGYSDWLGAVNGTIYRFIACGEHCDLLAASLAESTSPEAPERYRQEKLLYNFHSEGLSSLECLHFGTYFVGAFADPQRLDPMVNRRKVTPTFVTTSFEGSFPDAPLTMRLRAIEDSPELESWREIRNVLTHRAAPGREHRMGGPDGGTYWEGDLLAANSFQPRRAWLADALSDIVEGLDLFVSKHL